MSHVARTSDFAVQLGLDRFRCIALDCPGLGLSEAPPGHKYTVAEHSGVVEGFVNVLGLDGITMMLQDRGGPTPESRVPVHVLPRGDPVRL